MDALAQKISKAAVGEKLADCASAFALLCAYAIIQSTGTMEARVKMSEAIIGFMLETIMSETVCEGTDSKDQHHGELQ
jgi:hypothetical protein